MRCSRKCASARSGSPWTSISPLRKALDERRALIGQGVLGGEKNDLAVKPLLAQGRRGLNPGVAGADDDDRGQRHAQDVEEALWIGPHPVGAAMGAL